MQQLSWSPPGTCIAVSAYEIRDCDKSRLLFLVYMKAAALLVSVERQVNQLVLSLGASTCTGSQVQVQVQGRYLAAQTAQHRNSHIYYLFGEFQ